LVAPASPFDRAEFDRGVVELRQLGFEPVFDEDIFDRRGFVAGTEDHRSVALQAAWRRPDVDAIMAVRGGYGSVQLLPLLDVAVIRTSRTVFIGYSDVTSLHGYLASYAGLTSLHGPMIEGKIAAGTSAYDPASFLAGLSDQAIGELRPDGVEVLREGEAVGPLFGGTLTQIVGGLGTPYALRPPAGYILFIDEVGERPYRLDRMLTQVRQSGLLAPASAVVFNQLPRCDEPGGAPTARDTVLAALDGFPGPILFGFPSGHSTVASLTLGLGVRTRVVTGHQPGLVVEEAGASG
jgi:muramoyltetrapeptide carboxypeptidase